MTISTLLSLIAAVFILLYTGIGILKNLKKHWIMSVIRLGVTLVVAVVCIPLSSLIVRSVATMAYDILITSLDAGLVDTLAQVTVGVEGVKVLASLLVAPFLYILLFLVIHRICMIIIWIVEKFLTPVLLLKKRRVVSISVGAGTGLISAIILLIPLCGMITLTSHLVETAVLPSESGAALVQEEMLADMDLTTQDVVDIMDGMEQSPVVNVVSNTIGKPVFKAMTTAKLDPAYANGMDITINLESELCGLIKTAGCAVAAMDAFDKDIYTAEDKALLFATADTFFESEWVKVMATDVLVEMANSWKNNEDFAGMARPEMDATMNPLFNRVLAVLASETYDTMEEDIHVILDVLGDILVHDLLNTDGDYSALVQKLGTSGLLNEMLGKLEANPRLSVLVDELKTLSLRMVSNMLGTELLKDGRYAEMLDSVAGTLTDALDMTKTERDEAILDALKGDFANEGFDVPDDVVLEMADKMVADLGSDGEITSDELTDYLANHGDEAFEYIPDDLPIS